VRELREERKKKKKEEEERRGNEAEALPNRDRDDSLCRFLVLSSLCDRWLVLYLDFDVIYAPLRAPLVVLCIFISSIYHWRSHFSL